MELETVKLLDFSDQDAIRKLIEFLIIENSALKRRIQELEERIAKDSHNSSKPPSSDGLQKKRSTDVLKKILGRKRKPGGQKGHKGSTLEMTEKPDAVMIVRPEKCGQCGNSIPADVAPANAERRQEFDIVMRMFVTEYVQQTVHCLHCGAKNALPFPELIKNKTQYGPQFKSFIAYLNDYQLLPDNRIVEFVADVLKHRMSEGTIHNNNELFFKHLEKPEAAIKEALIRSDVMHNDESGVSLNGKLAWLHDASTPQLTHFEIHEKRGKEAMDAIGILPHFRGTSEHDFWQSYQEYTDCKHAYCNAHLIRELLFLLEERKQRWAGRMIDLLISAKEAVERAALNGKIMLSSKRIKDMEKEYKKTIRAGFRKHPAAEKETGKRGRSKQSKERNLLVRMRDHRKEILAFAYDFRIPFDNNLSERDIRMIKLKLKISGCFRTKNGARCFCRIRSYISTVRKNGKNVLDSLTAALQGRPFMPGFAD